MAAQKPRRRGWRRTWTPEKSAAARLTADCGEASSTTMTSVPGGANRVTEARQQRNRSGRLWLGMMMDSTTRLAEKG
jgi:hypothetical protein